MPVIETALTRLLGIEHPILLAPMGSAAGGRLAAAVTNAGGLGMIGSGYASTKAIRQELAEAGNARVGIGFILWALERNPAALEVRPERRQPQISRPSADRPRLPAASKRPVARSSIRCRRWPRQRRRPMPAPTSLSRRAVTRAAIRGRRAARWGWSRRWSMRLHRSRWWPLAASPTGGALPRR